MGEIILSICIGGFLIVSGISMIAILKKEEKTVVKGKGDKRHE